MTINMDGLGGPTLVDTFLTVYSQFAIKRDEWNKLSADDRKTITWNTFAGMQHDLAKALAGQLVRTAAQYHKIEEAPKFYVVLGAQGWEVDETIYGSSLEGYEHGASADGCDHPYDEDKRGLSEDELNAECGALVMAAREFYHLPDGHEILHMLQIDNGLL